MFMLQPIDKIKRGWGCCKRNRHGFISQTSDKNKHEFGVKEIKLKYLYTSTYNICLKTKVCAFVFEQKDTISVSIPTKEPSD